MYRKLVIGYWVESEVEKSEVEVTTWLVRYRGWAEPSYSIMIGEVTYHEGKKPFWRRVGAIRNPRWGRWRDLLLVIPSTDGVTLLFFVGCLSENNALQEYLPSLPDENDDFVSNLSPSFLSSSPLSHLSHIFFSRHPVMYLKYTHTHTHTRCKIWFFGVW